MAVTPLKLNVQMLHSKIVYFLIAQSCALKKSVMLLRMARVIRVTALYGCDFLILIQKLHGKEWGDVNGIHHTSGNNSIQYRPSVGADFGRAVI